MMEMAFGIELGDDVDGLSSPEKITALLEQKSREQEAKKQAAQERRARRKKTAKQLEAEAKQQQEEQSISQSIREADRKLSSFLHPDR